MRARNLEEGELNRPVLRAELIRMRSRCDGYVRDKVPNVVVLFRGQPIGRAEAAVVLVEVRRRQAAVQHRCWIVSANAKRLELIGVRIRLGAGSDKARKR